MNKVCVQLSKNNSIVCTKTNQIWFPFYKTSTGGIGYVEWQFGCHPGLLILKNNSINEIDRRYYEIIPESCKNNTITKTKDTQVRIIINRYFGKNYSLHWIGKNENKVKWLGLHDKLEL